MGPATWRLSAALLARQAREQRDRDAGGLPSIKDPRNGGVMQCPNSGYRCVPFADNLLVTVKQCCGPIPPALSLHVGHLSATEAKDDIVRSLLDPICNFPDA